jgi:5-formyltetrahydrofolate cyclo-ligase
MAMTKPDLRKLAFAARKAAHAAKADVTAALLAEIGPVTGRIISGYMPIRTEISPLAAMTALSGANRICVPVIAGKGLPLDFKEWTLGARMIPGPFGALIPETGRWLTPDILIVPLVAFDCHGQRLGYGGGFYDRTLEGLRARGRVLAVGFAFAAQQAEALPLEPVDQPLDMIVTEAGVMTF